ncbi:UBX domain-containing protein 11 isoform X1 [Arapaima gigas]
MLSRLKGTQKTSPSNGCDLSDLALMSAMVQKVGLLERKVHSQALDIRQKEKKIAVLEERLKDLQSSTEGSGGVSRLQELETMCRHLQEQVWEMEQFLNDYGMVWVGSAGDVGPAFPQEQEEEVRHGPSGWQPGASVNTPFCMDFDLVLQSIQDLNILAGEGECHVEVMQGGARLARRPPIPLVLYSNGIIMFDGPFRPYEEPSAQQCILDLMDGYFPSELQARFPDGIAFQVSDRRHEVFQEKPQWAVFPGKGRAVGGAQESSPDTAKHITVHPCKELSRLLPGGLHFLCQGQRKFVRGNISLLLLPLWHQVSAAPSRISMVTVVDTPASQSSRNRPARGCAVTTLRLRSEDGETVFVLQMLPSDTIGQVRRYLDAHRGQRHASYDIVSAFPQRCYDDDETLGACGLTRNTTLLLRRRPSPLTFRTSA